MRYQVMEWYIWILMVKIRTLEHDSGRRGFTSFALKRPTEHFKTWTILNMAIKPQPIDKMSSSLVLINTQIDHIFLTVGYMPCWIKMTKMANLAKMVKIAKIAILTLVAYGQLVINMMGVY